MERIYTGLSSQVVAQCKLLIRMASLSPHGFPVESAYRTDRRVVRSDDCDEDSPRKMYKSDEAIPSTRRKQLH